jgi:hypothetical protein
VNRIRRAPRHQPKRSLENLRSELFLESTNLGNAISQRQGGSDDRAGGCSADEVESIAKADRTAFDFLDQRFYSLEECDGGCAAHAAAVKRQDPFGAWAKQMSVAFGWQLVFGRHGSRDFVPRSLVAERVILLG